MKSFFATTNSYSLLLLRIGGGLAMLPYGLSKLGWIGEGSFGGTVQFMTGMGIPWIVAALVILGESLGALSVILGFCTRFCAASLVVIMAGAVVVTFGKGYVGGYVTPLVFLLLYLPLVLGGAGAASIDRTIAGKMR